ncbi:disrupted in renal carcinoma protein 2 homolog [Lingula anatina]|uniref:Disrupted in renal carcinoma protein 2 homolog n=1 Tax=Lingula anatina TaxID=7574 RepID=A0A1S3JRW1_LINAN|nr:disrupted in renal carcinoma protein 2 homolog [Lingula anatina]|eukprot:XP_013413057.1 disrupted in renal carcinoma protein 2 homolog [Lingula anatina]
MAGDGGKTHLINEDHSDHSDSDEDKFGSSVNVSAEDNLPAKYVYPGQPVSGVFPPVPSPATTTVGPDKHFTPVYYKRRWYIVFVYCVFSLIQSVIWNTWGPITVSAEYVFDWNDRTIDLLSNWGPISYLLTSLGFTWIMDEKGLRWACLASAFVVAVGAALRCIPMDPKSATWFIHSGQFLNGMGSTVGSMAGPLISNTWFPLSQRTTVTTITSMFTVLGAAAGFLIGPFIVRDPKSNTSSNATVNQTCNLTREEVAGDIHKLMYIEAGIAVAVFLAIIVYFPAKPPTPPSVTAAETRTSYFSGLLALVKKPQVWLIATPYGLSGVYATWSSVLGVNLQHHSDVSEKDAAFLGFWSMIAGVVFAVILARFADVFVGHLKVLVLALLVLATAAFAWFAVLLKFVDFHTPGWKVMIYAAIILGGMFQLGFPCLCFELACEASYPVAEGITTTFLGIINNIFAGAFLLIFMIIPDDKEFMNWAMVAAVALGVPATCLYKERYSRLLLDTQRSVDSGQRSDHDTES